MGLFARGNPVMSETVGADHLATPHKLTVAFVLNGFVPDGKAATAAELVAVALSVRGVAHVAYSTRRSDRPQLAIRVAERRRLLGVDQVRASHLVQRSRRIVRRVVYDQ